MATSSAVSQQSPSTPYPAPKQYWITSSALDNFREKVKNIPSMDNDRLSVLINELVCEAVANGKVEKVNDDGEDAFLIHLGMNTYLNERFFALVKRSANPEKGEWAVITIMTPKYVEARRAQWAKIPIPDSAKKQLSEVQPAIPRTKTPQSGIAPLTAPAKKSILLSYLPLRTGSADAGKRTYEEWASTAEVENRIREIKAAPGSVRVYKELTLGYRILDE